MDNKEVSKHGGDIYTDGVLKGKKILDFSSNINPLGVSKNFRNSLEEILFEVIKYPDYKYRYLKESIIKYIQLYYNTEIKSDEIILGNGASEVLDLFISSVKNIGIVVPSFIEYEEFALKYNNRITYIALKEDFQYNYNLIKSELSKLDGIILGNPNNPTGNLIDKKAFTEILDYCEENNKKVIIDEAFIEFTSNEKSLINEVEKYTCLFIVRAFTKFFGMPGVRLGYGISCDKELLEKLREKQLPWNVNSLGELALIKSYDDEDYILKSKNWIEEEVSYMINRLKSISLFKRVFDTNCNFILCELKDITEQELYDKLLEKGILIRKCSNFKGLNNRYVRFAIKSRELNNIFLHSLIEF